MLKHVVAWYMVGNLYKAWARPSPVARYCYCKLDFEYTRVKGRNPSLYVPQGQLKKEGSNLAFM